MNLVRVDFHDCLTLMLTSLDDTARLARCLAPLLQGGDFLALDGQLGAGKTSFVQALGTALGVRDAVASPTFVLLRIYRARFPIYHFDVYRLEDPQQVWDLGAEEYFWGDGVCLVEWASTLGELLPEDRLEVFLERLPSRPDHHAEAAALPAPSAASGSDPGAMLGPQGGDACSRQCTLRATGPRHQTLLRQWVNSWDEPT